MLYGNTLGHDFVFDDPLLTTKNAFVQKGFAGIPDIMTSHFHAGFMEGQTSNFLYRPLPLILLALEWAISPNNPFIGHLVNIILYFLIGVLVWKLSKKWIISKYTIAGLLFTFLFLSHPIHTEVVANIKSHDELLSLLFGLATFWQLYQYVENDKSKHLLYSLILYFLALGSKESSVTFLALIPLILWFSTNYSIPKIVKTTLLYLIPLSIFLLVRYAVVGSGSTPIDVNDNPIVGATNTGEYLGTAFMALGLYIQKMLFPYPLLSDYSYHVLKVVPFTFWKSLLALFLYVGLFIFSLYKLKTKNFLSFAILGFLATISIYSQMPIKIGTLFAERLAFAPSLFFLLFLFLLLLKLLEKFNGSIIQTSMIGPIPKIYLYTFIPIIFTFSFLTVQRNQDWKNNLTLFSKDSNTAPQSLRLNSGAGEELYIQQVKEKILNPQLISESSNKFNQSLSIKPNINSYIGLGNIAFFQKDFDGAIAEYQKALDLSPNNVNTITNLALVYREKAKVDGEQKGELISAINSLQKALDYWFLLPNTNKRDIADTYRLLGVAHGVKGDHKSALAFFENAKKEDPTYPNIDKDILMAQQYLSK